MASSSPLDKDWTAKKQQQQWRDGNSLFLTLEKQKSDADTNSSEDERNIGKMNTTAFLAPRDMEALKPCIGPNTIISIGFILYLCAIIWPPLLLLLTYILSKLLPYCFLKNDDAVARRTLWRTMELKAREGIIMDATKQNYDSLHRELFKILFPDKKLINLEEKYWVNERGMCLMTSIMAPANKEIEAVLCFCHGYMDNSSFLKRYEYQRLVKRGIAFVSIEYEGHGRSDGPLCYINKFDNIIQDAYTFFSETCHSRFPGKKYFLMGESMGGAVAFDIYLKSISSTATATANTATENALPCSSTNHTQKVESAFSFAGVILCCPMAKISQELLPKAWVIRAFQQIVGPSGCNRWIGLLPLSPTGEMNGFRLVQKRALAQSVPTWYGLRKPRLATGRELLLTTQRISNSLKLLDAPVLILHGLADTVTDPTLSQALYDECSSTDKQIKLYEGMMHTLTAGETDENIDQVFNDVINWIEARI